MCEPELVPELADIATNEMEMPSSWPQDNNCSQEFRLRSSEYTQQFVWTDQQGKIQKREVLKRLSMGSQSSRNRCVTTLLVEYGVLDTKYGETTFYPIGGFDAAVKLCEAQLSLSQWASFADLEVELSSVRVLSGENYTGNLLEANVPLTIGGHLPESVDCADPILFGVVDDIRMVFELKVEAKMEEWARTPHEEALLGSVWEIYEL